ncbi:hypothetical protein ACYTX9_09360, partial [Streptococcus pyogenes]
PAANQGNVLTDMLTLTPESKTAIERALAAQQATLLAAYAEAIGRPIAASAQPLTVGAAQALMDSAKASRLTSERIPRLFISILLFAAIG